MKSLQTIAVGEPRDPIRALELGRGGCRGMSPPARQSQEIWFSLAKRKWSSLVLVPAGEGESAADVARSLVDVGRWLRDTPTTAIVDHPLDRESVFRIASLIGATREGGCDPIELVVAIRPVLEEPLGLALTRTAEAVVLCIEMGRTRLAAARRTIELIGRDRIDSCILVG